MADGDKSGKLRLSPPALPRFGISSVRARLVGGRAIHPTAKAVGFLVFFL